MRAKVLTHHGVKSPHPSLHVMKSAKKACSHGDLILPSHGVGDHWDLWLPLASSGKCSFQELLTQSPHLEAEVACFCQFEVCKGCLQLLRTLQTCIGSHSVLVTY